MKRLLTCLHLVLIRSLYGLLSVCARFRWAFGVALIWRKLTHLYRTGEKIKTHDLRLLVLDKTGLTGDLMEVFPPGDAEVCLYALPRQAVKAVAAKFLPESVRSDVAYLSDVPGVEASKTAYREFLVRVWRRYGCWLRMDGVVTANYSFYAEREFGAALRMLSIPFLALHKECVAPPIMWEGYEKNCREEKGPFHGHAITVYNERWRQIMIRAGVIAAERIATVGCPRMDVYHRLRQSGEAAKAGRKLVAFFSFLPTSGLPYIGGGEKAIHWPQDMKLAGASWSWRDLARDAHLAILDLAEQRPDLDFVIKVKVGRAYKTFIEPLFSRELPANVSIVEGGEAEAVIRQASVITGFNSTTLLEGIAAGKPVVVPRFGEAADPATWCGILELGDAVLWADSMDTYKRLLQDCVDHNVGARSDLSEEAGRILDAYVGNPDGNAGKRMRVFVLEQLGYSRSG